MNSSALGLEGTLVDNIFWISTTSSEGIGENDSLDKYDKLFMYCNIIYKKNWLRKNIKKHVITKKKASFSPN